MVLVCGYRLLLAVVALGVGLLWAPSPGSAANADPDATTEWIEPPTTTYKYPWGLLSIERASGSGAAHWEDATSLTGNWGGLRDRLRSEYGLSLVGTYLMESAGNPVGGERQGVTYTHDIFLAIIADLGRLIDWPGTYFLASASDRVGNSVSGKDIGNALDVQQIYGGETIRLAQLALGKRWLEGKIDVVAGRINALDDFVASPLYCNAQSAAFCGNPFSFTADISISSYPFSQWGARLRWLPTDAVSFMVGTYNSFGNFRANGYHGVDFSIRHNSGVIAIGEVTLRPNDLPGAPGTFRLPGHVKVGGYFDNEPLTDFATGRDERGTWGAYVALDQELYGERGLLSEQGLTAFFAAHYAPPDVNTFEWFVDAGLVYEGLIPGRDRDIVGFYVAYGDFSGLLADSQTAMGEPGQTFETVLELNYDIALLNWLSVQPDVQGIIHPGGAGDIPDALVLGLQIVIPF